MLIFIEARFTERDENSSYLGVERSQDNPPTKHETNKKDRHTDTESGHIWSSSTQCHKQHLERNQTHYQSGVKNLFQASVNNF